MLPPLVVEFVTFNNYSLKSRWLVVDLLRQLNRDVRANLYIAPNCLFVIVPVWDAYPNTIDIFKIFPELANSILVRLYIQTHSLW